MTQIGHLVDTTHDGDVETLRVVVHEDTRKELRDMLEEVVHQGLIYWEPNTSRGHERKADMVARAEALLASTAPDPKPGVQRHASGSAGAKKWYKALRDAG